MLDRTRGSMGRGGLSLSIGSAELIRLPPAHSDSALTGMTLHGFSHLFSIGVRKLKAGYPAGC